MSGPSKPTLATVLETFAALGERLKNSGSSPEAPSGAAPDTLELAAREIQESVQALNLARHLVRVDPHDASDCIGVRGRPVELRVGVRRLLDTVQSGWAVRFVFDGDTVAQATTREDGVARGAFVPDRAGSVELGFAIDDPRRRPQRSERQNPRIFVQVVDREPVVAVDAGLLRLGEEEPGLDLGVLAELAAAGFALCYFDVSTEERFEAARARIDALGLPRGAWLPQPLDAIGPIGGQADFRVTLGVQGMRLLRARGIPLVAAITELKATTEPAGPRTVEGVAILSLAQLRQALEQPGELDDLRTRAEKFSDQRDRVWQDQAAGDLEPAQIRCLDLMTATPACDGNTLHFEPDNRRARERLLSLIECAEHSVHLQAYILSEGRLADHLLVRLIGRARAGVRVRLALDALYGGHGVLGSKNPVVRALLDEPGVEVLAIDPISIGSTLDATLVKQRDHRKLLVVDDRVGLISGRNLADEYYTAYDESPITDTTAADKIPWLDAHVEVHGPLVQRIQQNFLELWQRHGGRPRDPDEPGAPDCVAPAPPAEACADTRARLIFHDGLQDANALAAYEALVLQARERICIVNDFPVISTLAEMLLQARARGVQVQVLTGSALARKLDGEFFTGSVARRMFEYMTKRRYEALVRGGVEVHELCVPAGPLHVVHGGAIRPYVHAKVMVVDGRLVCLGSANLDVTASYWERELNVLAESRRFASVVQDWIDGLLRDAITLDLDSEEWQRERAERAIADTLWPDFLYS